MSVVVPACGVVDCDDPTKTHRHIGWVRGLRVVVEPRRVSAPGWAWSQPHGTVTSTRPYGLDHREVVDVQLDGHTDTTVVPTDLLVRFHTWMGRPVRATPPKLLPRLPRTHRLDGDVYEPPLFPEAS